MAGLVNGVLRNAVRTKGTLKMPDSLAVRYSHPQKLIDALEKDLGSEVLEPMLAANNDIPLTVVQVNALRTTVEALTEMLEEEQVKVLPHAWMPDCLVLANTGNLEALESFKEGLFYVQDAASKLAVQCAQIPVGEKTRVLDCCAAPGGKTFAAGIIMKNEGRIRSGDIHRHKTELIQRGADRLGLTNVLVREQDATENHPSWFEKMDVVLADVPCSGYGIIRKKPDIRYKDMASLAGLPAIQSAILDNASRYVRRGGTLVYSTCTVLPEENERVTDAFLRAHPDFTYDTFALPGPIGTVEGHITLWPQRHGTDGFYICRMTRKE